MIRNAGADEREREEEREREREESGGTVIRGKKLARLLVPSFLLDRRRVRCFG